LAAGIGHDTKGVTIFERQLVALENAGCAWLAVIAYADHGVGGHAAGDYIA
jgi:hypothetical protein